MKKITLALALAVLMSHILLTPSAYIDALKTALVNCYTTLIPSLIPFMMLSQLFCDSSAGNTVSAFLSPITRKLFRLNKSETKITLMSLIGGYPCGAKLISNALDKNELTLNSATRLLKFSVNPSPSYMILAVGVGLYQNKEIGFIFFFSNLIATLLLAFITRPKSAQKQTETPPLPLSQSLVKSVCDSTNAMLLICGFTLFFSLVLQFFKNLGLFKIHPILTALISLSLDVVTGVNNTCKISFFLTAVAISFGGISVIFQCMAMLKGQKINFLKIIPFRILHSLLTGVISYFIIKIKDFPIETVATLKPTLSTQPPIMSLVFVFTCVLFLVSLKRSSKDEKTFRQ